MYFNVYFKEMKIGAQREARRWWSSCVQRAPGQAALQWPHATLRAACRRARAARPHPLPLAAPLHPTVSPSPLQRRDGEGLGGERGLAWPPSIPAPGRFLIPGEGDGCCLGRDAELRSGCSTRLQRCQLCCAGAGARGHPGTLVPAADRDGPVSASPDCKPQSSRASLCKEIGCLPCTLRRSAQGSSPAYHRITEWQGVAGTSVGHPAQPPAQAGSPRAGCTGPHPDRS